MSSTEKRVVVFYTEVQDRLSNQVTEEVLSNIDSIYPGGIYMATHFTVQKLWGVGTDHARVHNATEALSQEMLDVARSSADYHLSSNDISGIESDAADFATAIFNVFSPYFDNNPRRVVPSNESAHRAEMRDLLVWSVL